MGRLAFLSILTTLFWKNILEKLSDDTLMAVFRIVGGWHVQPPRMMWMFLSLDMPFALKFGMREAWLCWDGKVSTWLTYDYLWLCWGLFSDSLSLLFLKRREMSDFLDADPLTFFLTAAGNEQVKKVSNVDKELYFRSQHSSMINGLQSCHPAYGPVVR